MKTNHSVLKLIYAATITICSVSLPAHAEYRELDAIVAVVEDDVVLASELRGRFQQVAKSMRDQKVQMPPDDVVLSQIMERLIH